MITGDHLLIAVETAKLLELGDVVLGGSPEEHVLPNIKTADGEMHFLLLLLVLQQNDPLYNRIAIFISYFISKEKCFLFSIIPGLPLLDEVTKKAPANLVAMYGDHIR